MVGDPESGADTTAFRALWQIRGDVEGGYSVVRSAGVMLSVKDKKLGSKFVPFVGCKDDKILEGNLIDVTFVSNGKCISFCICKINQ